MATLKMILDGVYMTSSGQEATGTATYYCDGVSGSDMNVLNNAMNAVPFGVGDKFNVTTQGGPSVRVGSRGNGIPVGSQPGIRRTQHALRVMQKTAHLEKTNNAHKVIVELGLRSPPALSESSASSLIQKRNEFYLTGSNDSPKRKQIILTYYVPAGTYGPNIPPSVLRLPQSAATCTKYFYAESFRASNTFFYDEISPNLLQKLKQQFTGRINGSVFLYQDSIVGGSSGDARQWLCTALEADTPDNGMSYRVTAEWTYNVEYWDTVVVSTDAHGQPVKLDQKYVDRMWQSLASGGNGRQFNNGANGQIPAPITETGAGIGRFPIYQAADMWSLLKFIRKDIPASSLE